MVYFKQNYIFPSFPPWIQHFPVGLTFSRAVELLIPMETYRTCYFSEGGGGGGGCPDPLPRTPPPLLNLCMNPLPCSISERFWENVDLKQCPEDKQASI